MLVVHHLIHPPFISPCAMNRLLALLLPVIALSSGTTSVTPAPSDPASLARHWEHSVQAETIGDYDTAIQHLQTFAHEGGDAFMSQLRAGWLSSLKADYPKAAEAYAAAARLQPASLTPLLGLLSAAQGLNDHVRIERAAEALIRLEPTNYKAQMALAGLRYTDKDYRRALSSYRRVLAAYPEDNDAASGAAWCASNLGEHHEALALFTRILSLNPSYPLAQTGFELCGGKAAKVASNN